MIKWFFSINIIVSIISCSESSSYEGFSITQTGLNYKIETLGEPYQSIHDSDFITFSVTKFSDQGTVISDTRIVEDTVFHPISDSGLFEFLGLLNVGDSGSYVQNSQGGPILVSVKLISTVSHQEMRVRHLLSHLPDSTLANEKLKIANWLIKYEKDSIEVINGIFKIKQVSGYGENPMIGKEVTFHMESFLSNGEMVESTKKVKKPFSYFVGDQDQVIPGVRFAIHSMQQKEVSTFIIPSFLAYGKMGSNTQIVPPNDPLLYEIELLKIRLNDI